MENGPKLNDYVEQYDDWVKKTEQLFNARVVSAVMEELDQIMDNLEQDTAYGESRLPDRLLLHLKSVHSSLEVSFGKCEYRTVEGANSFGRNVVEFKLTYEQICLRRKGKGR